MQVTVESISNGYLVTQPQKGASVAMPGSSNAVKTSCATLADVLTLLGQIMPVQTATPASTPAPVAASAAAPVSTPTPVAGPSAAAATGTAT